MSADVCPDCLHPWSEHRKGEMPSMSGCYHRLDRLADDQSADRPDYDGDKWCPCTEPPRSHATHTATFSIGTAGPVRVKGQP